MPFLLPVTDNLLFLNQQKSEKKFHKRRVDLGTACIQSGHATDQATVPDYKGKISKYMNVIKKTAVYSIGLYYFCYLNIQIYLNSLYEYSNPDFGIR